MTPFHLGPIRHWFSGLLYRPGQVFFLCALFVTGSLIVEGSLFRLWNLHWDQKHLEREIDLVRQQTKELQMKIQKVSDPSFLEVEARNRFDLVEKGDLVFVFTDEVEESP